jgi:hypothetical protein
MLADNISREPDTSARRAIIACLVTLLAIGVVNWLLLPKSTLYLVDTNSYLGGAISLAQGQGYHSATQVDHPRVTIYPPLQSFYLSWWWRADPAFPDNIPRLNAGMLSLSLGVCACLFVLLWKKGLPLMVITVFTLTLGLSPAWMVLLCCLYSDVLLALLGYLLWLLWWSAKGPPKHWQLLATGLLLAACLLTRTAALAWVAGAGLLLLWRFRECRWWYWLLVLLPAGGAALWWKQWTAGSYSYESYFLTRLQESGSSYVANTLWQAWQYLGGEHMSEMLFMAAGRLGTSNLIRQFPPWFASLLSVLFAVFSLGLALLVALGCRATWSRLNLFFLLVLAVYLAELIIWPFPLGSRVLFPLLPVLIWWGWAGYLAVGGRWFTTRQLTGLALVFLSLNLVLNTLLAMRLVPYLKYQDKTADARQLADWITSQTPADARLGLDPNLPQTHLHYWTGRLFIGGDAGHAPWSRPEVRLDYLLTTTPLEQLVLPPGVKLKSVFSTKDGGVQAYALEYPPGNATTR